MVCPLPTPLAPSRDAHIPAIRRACRGTIPRAGSCTMASVRHLLPSDQQRRPLPLEQPRVTLSASLEGSAATRQLGVASRSTRRDAEGATKPCKKGCTANTTRTLFHIQFFFSGSICTTTPRHCLALGSSLPVDRTSAGTSQIPVAQLQLAYPTTTDAHSRACHGQKKMTRNMHGAFGPFLSSMSCMDLDCIFLFPS